MQSTTPFDHAQSHRFGAGPAWRFQLAEQQAVDAGHRPLRRERDDIYLKQATGFFRLSRREPDGAARAAEQFPGIAAAVQIEQDADLRDRLKILVLGNCPPPEIAARLGVEEVAVEFWEALFFDVRGSREATGWISAEVIQPERDRGRDELAAKMKLACACGPVGARAVLNLDARAPLAAAEQLFERKLRLHLKWDEAAQAPLGSDRDRRSFLRHYASLQLAQQRVDLARRRLEARCQDLQARHELAMRRLEVAEERERHRHQERLQRASASPRRRKARDDARRAQQIDMERLWQEEHEAALARAAASPLARLTWSSTECDRTEIDPPTHRVFPAETAYCDADCNMPQTEEEAPEIELVHAASAAA